MNLLDAIETVLADVRVPMKCPEITRLVLERQLWQTQGKTPEATVHAQLVMDIKRRGPASRFQRTDKGTFALRAWGLPEYKVVHAVAKTRKAPGRPTPRPAKAMSFTDAAEQVLEQFGHKQPMHYRAITKKVLELRLVHTEGQTPEATLYAQILTEINRKTKRGETPRFVRYGKGMMGLARWQAQGLAYQIEQHNAEVREKLRADLLAMKPAEFEALVSRLLTEIGFDNVELTPLSGDGGIDVRGTLVVGDVIRTRMAVQVKRWKQNVQAPVVQQVRGSLGTHEQGLIITTSDFSAGARDEAERPNAIPVALMDGKQLVSLLVEYNLGVRRTRYDLIEMGEAEEE